MIPDLIIFSLKLWLIAFLLNMVWEVNHSVLYKTCYVLPYKKCMRLLTLMSFKDGLFITLFFAITATVFQNLNIFTNNLQLSLFVILCLTFSFLDERISIKLNRWEYTPSMPTVFKVGITPLLEVAVTGVLALVIITYLM